MVVRRTRTRSSPRPPDAIVVAALPSSNRGGARTFAVRPDVGSAARVTAPAAPPGRRLARGLAEAIGGIPTASGRRTAAGWWRVPAGRADPGDRRPGPSAVTRDVVDAAREVPAIGAAWDADARPHAGVDAGTLRATGR